MSTEIPVEQLTEGQVKGCEQLLAFTVSDKWAIGVEGPPGTGKTTMLKSFIRRCPYRIRVTAPTNKATKVLREIVGYGFTNVTFSTTYAALGLKMSNDDEIKSIFKPNDLESLDEVDILVVDERSMVGENLHNYIEGECRSRGIKVIFVGDRNQLPPVKEEIALNFNLPDNIVLTEIVRQAKDNPIIKLLWQIKDCMETDGWPEFRTSANDEGGVYAMDYASWCRNMRAGFASDTYRHKDNSFKTLAWTNERVSAHNQQIRKSIYGPEQALLPFVVGERVVAAKPILPLPSAPFEGRMYTDEEGVIEAMPITDHPAHSAEYKVWNLTIAADDGHISAYVLHKDSVRDYDNHLADLTAQAKARKISWQIVHDFKETFHDIRPCHAVTTHKSQGSTYENVFVDVTDIARNPNRREALQMLFVGISRGSKRVMLRVSNA